MPVVSNKEVLDVMRGKRIGPRGDYHLGKQNPTAGRGDARARPHPDDADSASQAGASAPPVGAINRAWVGETSPHVLSFPVYRGVDGLPYRWDGIGFVDPKGLRVITPPDLVETARALLNRGMQLGGTRPSTQNGMAGLTERERLIWQCGYNAGKGDTPPAPQSAMLSWTADRIADAIIALNNAKPRSPTRAEIIEAVAAVLTPQAAGAHDDIQDSMAPHLWGAGNWPGLRDEDGEIIAFKLFAQYDGPKMRHYTLNIAGGRTVTPEYQSFAWQSAEPSKIVERINELGRALMAAGATTIVWRARPEFIYDVNADRYRFFCRFHILPYKPCLDAKKEGEKTPEA